MENLKHKVWDIPIYGGKLIVVDTDSAQAFNTKFKIPAFQEQEEMYAFAVKGSYKRRRAHFVVLNTRSESPITHGVISHEALHVALDVLEDIGFVLDYNNPEPITYLISWVVDKTYEFFKLNRIAIKTETV